jgi:hypothetical protein
LDSKTAAYYVRLFFFIPEWQNKKNPDEITTRLLDKKSWRAV